MFFIIQLLFGLLFLGKIDQEKCLYLNHNKEDIIPYLYKRNILNIYLLDILLRNYYPLSSSHIALFIRNNEDLFLDRIFQSYLPFPLNILTLLDFYKKRKGLTNNQIHYLNYFSTFDGTDEKGNSLIMLSVKMNNIKIVKKLIHMRVNIFRRDINNNTLLHIASTYNHMEMVKLLIKNKVDINAKNKVGNTALMISCIMGNKEMMEYLMEQDNIDINAQNNQGNTGVHLYCFYHSHDILRSSREEQSPLIELLKKFKWSIENNEKKTPLLVLSKKYKENGYIN